LETSQGVELFDRSRKTPALTEAGRVLVAQARQVLRQAELFENIATEIAAGLEPELTLAVDNFLPTQPVIDSLQALREKYPNLPVTLYTEGLGAAERRLRNRSAALALCVLLPTAQQELQTYPLMSIRLVPVASSSHPLATETRPITRDVLQEHVQLILTDPYDSSGPSHGVVSSRIWRFVDMGSRLDFLLAGSGWATIPAHLVEPYLSNGKLVELKIGDPAVVPGFSLPIYAVHERSRPPRPAARWLLEDIQRRLSKSGTRRDAGASVSKQKA
jgi:DNA-binding transcriptional LysR family regulator